MDKSIYNLKNCDMSAVLINSGGGEVWLYCDQTLLPDICGQVTKNLPTMYNMNNQRLALYEKDSLICQFAQMHS